MSSLAIRELSTASSVDWTTASKNGSRLFHGMKVSWSYALALALSALGFGSPEVRPPGFAVENARNRSPEKCEPLVPVLARPEVTRRAKALHWLGNSGASVATTAITEPAPAGAAFLASRIGL